MAPSAPNGLSPGVAETHSGVVFFFGDRAYKLKKPVDLGFLDFRTREARQHACHREVELNRRLSPDVYLGVADVVGPEGQLADHLVVMRRMPDHRRLSALALGGGDLGDDVAAVARLLADFHRRAERGPDADRAASRDALAGRWSANTREMSAFAGRFLDAGDIDEVQRLASGYLAGRAPLFEQRRADGRAVDGHGDLLADDIFLLDDGPRILDCLEFDDALRLEDGLADAAFLVMDLERLGRADLAGRFLDEYRRAAGDDPPPSLVHHHVAYRAQVRAKVSAIRAEQGLEGAAAKAQALLEQAMRHLRAGEVRLILVGGLPGTGKSTVAAALGGELDAVVLRADVVRKELVGLDADAPAAAPFGAGIYAPGATAATYRALLERAEAHLGLGRTVVLDASWSSAAARAAGRELAEATSSRIVELRCTLDAAVAAGRIRARAARGGDASDADELIAARMAEVADAWPEAQAVDTSPPPDEVLATVLAATLATGGVAPPSST